jgi:Skp family chaperone for outer membrane proteins
MDAKHGRGARRIVLAGLVACGAWGAWSTAQDRAAPEPAAARAGTRIAVCDLGHVLRNSRKFQTLEADLKQEVERLDQQAQQKAAPLRQMQLELEKLPKGSPAAEARQREVLKATREFEEFRNQVRQDVLRKEGDIYRTVSLEAIELLEALSQEKGYDLVLRFSRRSVAEAQRFDEIQRELNDTVLRHRPEDDLTEPLAERLNARYGKK